MTVYLVFAPALNGASAVEAFASHATTVLVTCLLIALAISSLIRVATRARTVSTPDSVADHEAAS